LNHGQKLKQSVFSGMNLRLILFGSFICFAACDENFYDEQMFLSARKFVAAVRSIDSGNFTSTFVDPAVHNDELCWRQVERISEGLSKGELWAVEIFDTWTKLQFGLLEGNLVDFGLFDKCVRFETNLGVDGTFRGQHCMTGFRAKAPEVNETLGFLTRNL
jgi:hypothetical protein